MKPSYPQTIHRSPSAWERAEAYGIDMSLLKANLRRSVAERWRPHDAALRAMVSLREAVKKMQQTADILRLEALREREIEG